MSSNLWWKTKDIILREPTTNDDESNDDFSDNSYSDNEFDFKKGFENPSSSSNSNVNNNKTEPAKNPLQISNSNSGDDSHNEFNRKIYNQTYDLTSKKSKVNPIGHKTIEHTMHIDSAHRERIFQDLHNGEYHHPENINTIIPTYNNASFNTKFSYVPTAPILRVISMKLVAVNLPSTWYTFDYKFGNTVFRLDKLVGGQWETIGNKTSFIDIGNYTKKGLLRQLEAKTKQLNGGVDCIEFYIEGEAPDGSEPGTGRLKGKSLIAETPLKIVYLSDSFTTNPPPEIGNAFTYGPKRNKNLGRHLGMRRAPDAFGEYAFEIPVSTNARGELLGETSLDVFGSRYFYLVINEHASARASISKAGTGTLQETSQGERSEIPDNMHILAKINLANTGLTRSTGLEGLTNALTSPTIVSDIAIQTNVRKYFGPVTIEKLDIELIDAYGYRVDLHDHDWSFTLKIDRYYDNSDM